MVPWRTSGTRLGYDMMHMRHFTWYGRKQFILRAVDSAIDTPDCHCVNDLPACVLNHKLLTKAEATRKRDPTKDPGNSIPYMHYERGVSRHTCGSSASPVTVYKKSICPPNHQFINAPCTPRASRFAMTATGKLPSVLCA